MMWVAASSIGYKAHALVESCEGSLGVVVNAFTSTINLRVGDELVVVTTSKHKSPISINIEAPDYSLNLESLVSVGESPKCGGGYLAFNRLRIELSKAHIYYNYLRTALTGADYSSSTRIAEFRRKLAIIIDIMEDLVEEPLDETSAKIEHIISRLRTHMAHSCNPQIVDFSELMGVGQGFTPSSDDLILGFTAAWNSVAAHIGKLCPLAAERLQGNTSWVSYKLVENATRLDLLEPIDSLLYNLVIRGNPDKALDYCIDLAGLGHSSGVYILKGILAGLDAALECMGADA